MEVNGYNIKYDNGGMYPQLCGWWADHVTAEDLGPFDYRDEAISAALHHKSDNPVDPELAADTSMESD